MPVRQCFARRLLGDAREPNLLVRDSEPAQQRLVGGLAVLAFGARQRGAVTCLARAVPRRTPAVKRERHAA
jgi:hypothetical protein